MSELNFYEFLGIPREASVEEITKAFREKALALHPDKNRNDPDVTSKFQLLTRAYQTLNDPVRRKKYDATLPAPPQQPQRITDLQELWTKAGMLYFEQSDRYTQSIDAMRVSMPLILEDDALLIVGMEPSHANLLGYLTATDVQIKIRKIISELYGKPLDFRAISGTTVKEWQAIKSGEEAVQRKKHAMMARDFSEPAVERPSIETNGERPTGDAWEALLDRMLKNWTLVDTRTYPQSRARFALDHIPHILQAESAARAGGMPEEMIQRQLARILDRLGNMTSIESGVLAIEYLRYRSRMHGGIV